MSALPIDMHLREIDEPVFDPERAAWMAAVFCGSDVPDEDEIAELERSMRTAGIYRGARIEQAIEDARRHDDGLRKFNREYGRR